MRSLLFILALTITMAGASQTNRTTAQRKSAPTAAKTAPTAPKTTAKKATTTQRNATTQRKPVRQQSQYKEITYTIKGAAHGYDDGEWVKLCNPTAKGLAAYDSTQIKDGQFVFKGKEKNIPHMQFIVVGEGAQKNLTEIFLEEGTSLVEITAGEKLDRVTGTKHNNIYTPYRDSLNVIYTQLFACISESVRFKNSEEDRESYKAGAEMLRNKVITTSYDFASKNLGNWVGLYLFAEYYKRFTPQQNKALLARLPQKFALLPITAEIRKYVKTQK